MEKTVLYEVADGVGLITLNRPERSNAWTGRMAFEYRTAMHQADQDERVGAIVVTGSGRYSVAPSSLRSVKRQASADLFRTISESNDEAVRLMHEMIGSEDYRQGVQALSEKRSPGFAARYQP